MPAWGASRQQPTEDSDWEDDPQEEKVPLHGSSGGATPRSSTRDSSDPDDSALRKRSVLAYNHGASHREVDEGQYPTNEQVVEALQVKIAKSVEVARRYRRVLWYSLFVTVYLVVLYLQANAYKSADVVSTLQNALMVDGSLSMTFNNEDEVLAYLANKILLPTWKDPVCGDGQCEYPWEFPSYGRFGCKSDCGAETNTTKIAVNIKANFLGHPTVSPRVLMSSVRWNLCLNDPERTARGEADLCWWKEDQTFSDVKVNRIEAAEVVDGAWYIIIKGDYTGRVSGDVYDLTEPEAPELIELTPQWEKCRLPNATDATSGSASRACRVQLRKLMASYNATRTGGSDDPQLFRRLRAEHFPELPPLNATDLPTDLQSRVAAIEEKRRELERIRDRLRDLREQQREAAGSAPDTSHFEET